jgi:cutinase
MLWNLLPCLLAVLPLVNSQLFPHQVVNLTGPKPLSSISHDDVLDRQGCKSMTVLFAADSKDFGNVGSLTGPKFFQALASKIGGRDQLALQGIDYPVDYTEYSEDWEYYEFRDPEGPRIMTTLAKQVMETCPLTHLVLGGYGQGAQLVHDAASQMQKHILDFVRAGMFFLHTLL